MRLPEGPSRALENDSSHNQIWLLFTAHSEFWFADGMNIGF
jgi:hypothetical protein